MAQIHPARLSIYDAFHNACNGYPRWDELAQADRDSFVRRMERSCFNLSINDCTADGIGRLFTERKFVQRYSANCARVISNLDHAGSVGSTYLLDKIIAGEISPYDVASLAADQLCPSAGAAERAEIELRKQQKIQTKVSRAYICRKCDGNETIPLEYQGRSSDEGSNYSIRCVKCDFVWRR